MAWKRQVDDRRAEQPLRMRARVTQLVGLGEDVSSGGRRRARRGAAGLAREVSLAMPAGLVVNQVNGANGRRLGRRRHGRCA